MARIVNILAVTMGTLAALSAAGCGGGGGGQSSSGQSPAAAVQQRSRAWDSAVIREDLDGLMDLYSSTFLTDDGQNKAQTRLEHQLMFERYDFLQIDVISEEFIVNSTSTRVNMDGSYRVLARDRESGEQISMDVQFLLEWGKEEGVWRLVHEFTGNGSTQSLRTAMARRKR